MQFYQPGPSLLWVLGAACSEEEQVQRGRMDSMGQVRVVSQAVADHQRYHRPLRPQVQTRGADAVLRGFHALLFLHAPRQTEDETGPEVSFLSIIFAQSYSENI